LTRAKSTNIRRHLPSDWLAADSLVDQVRGIPVVVCGIPVAMQIAVLRVALHVGVGVEVGRRVASVLVVGVEVGRRVASVLVVGVEVGRRVASDLGVGVEVRRGVAWELS